MLELSPQQPVPLSPVGLVVSSPCGRSTSASTVPPGVSSLKVRSPTQVCATVVCTVTSVMALPAGIDEASMVLHAMLASEPL